MAAPPTRVMPSATPAMSPTIELFFSGTVPPIGAGIDVDTFTGAECGGASTTGASSGGGARIGDWKPPPPMFMMSSTSRRPPGPPEGRMSITASLLPPPAPPPRRLAFSDAVSADSSPDVPVSACAPTYEGSIPGAILDLSKTPCAFSISAAKGVFNLGYKLSVESAQKLSVGGDLGGCPPQASSIHGGIATFEQVGGNSQKWCLCDTGLCAPVKPPFTASTPGSYDVAFTWDGMNWSGPSDTGNKPGPAFPAGSYTFSVSVSGEHQLPDGTTETFAAVAKLPITLTP